MNCNHEYHVFVRTPELKHYGKDICQVCGKFLGWAKKPETVAREADNARALVELRKAPLLAKERAFIESLEAQMAAKGPKISPLQQGWLTSLWNKYGSAIHPA